MSLFLHQVHPFRDMVWIQRLIVFCFSVSSAYGLGVGGAPWSEEEVWNSSVTYWTSGRNNSCTVVTGAGREGKIVEVI